jgi:hypothetical protein
MPSKPDLESLLNKLPPFIQKGNKFCKLAIYKEGGVYVKKYTNTAHELLDHDSDLTALASRMLQKLQELDGTKGYIIRWDFWQ